MSRQRVVKFGSAAPLTGVLTEPVAGVARKSVSVVILNSGILHHVGANRLHVQIARKLAELGHVSLRFDFSGVGDSEARRDNLSFEQSAPLETTEAIDYLVKSQGAGGAVLIGLCSGADVAHLTAVTDHRVLGLGLMDPWAYRTTGYWLHYYARRLTTLSVYLNWLRVRLARARDRRGQSTAADPDPDMYEMPSYAREFPPRDAVARDLQTFVRRKVELLVLFSGGLEEYNHRGQYQTSFSDVDFNQQLRERHIAGSTHVFSAIDHQRIAVREVTGWISDRFGGASLAIGAENDPPTSRTA